ncbi:aldose epimerase family protein [Shimia thalassica]|uniref:aldose epimerase family protein n=1 Tax=Shimia thalassica TaxID=1715693 RepID=UPI00273376AB|nr:aldose epimerase family protein [Shimia thalassica]MDP2520078.1 aldose epimerase family protein [Shimia thalassica]
MGARASLESDSVKRHRLSDGDVSVSILNLGCITQDWRVPLGEERIPVVLGYASPQDYLHNPNFLGPIAGRVANRIENASFSIDGERFDLVANEGEHCLHGGPLGIGKRLWDISPDGDKAVRLNLRSEHGDQGFPGRVDFEVTISLAGNTLTYDMRAKVDRPTPINLAQHSYYNLMGGSEDITRHRLCLAAESITQTDSQNIANGQTQTVSGTRYDFTSPKELLTADPSALGYDHNYVLSHASPCTAKVTAPNGLSMRLETDQPCLQFYTASKLQSWHPRLSGQTHAPFYGLCLEPQGYPNAVNIPAFPTTIVTPDHPYRQLLKVSICAE